MSSLRPKTSCTRTENIPRRSVNTETRVDRTKDHVSLPESSVVFSSRHLLGHESSAAPVESEEISHLLSEVNPGLFSVWNPGNKLQKMGRQRYEFTGISLDPFLPDNGFSVVHPEDRDRVADILQVSLPLGEPFSYEFRYRQSDGCYRWFQASVQPRKDSVGNVICWCTLLADIDDRRAPASSLINTPPGLSETTSRMSTVAEIAASVVHEISQPLSAVITNAQAAIRYLSAESVNLEAAKSSIQLILRDSKDACHIVKGIRTLFRRTDPGKTHIELGSVIEDVLLLFEGEMRSLDIKSKVSVSHDLPAVPGDKLQIQQVLVNLVSNAVGAMEESSEWTRELEVRAYQEHNMIITEVADRGHGLSHPDKMFEAFFTTKSDGMGMGLRICKSIIQAHKGEIWARSRQDRGAIFAFSLPLPGRQVYA